MNTNLQHLYRENEGLFISEPNSTVQKDVRRKPCLFLDRDGVVIEEKHYLSRAENVEIIDGAQSTIERAYANGYRIVIVTNQSGIARGLFNWKDYINVTEQMIRLLGQSGKCIDCILACPMHEEAVISKYKFQHHVMRKPNAGMIDYTLETYETCRENSIMVGDKICDIKAGMNANIFHLYHVLTGHGRTHRIYIDKLSREIQSGRINTINSIKDLKQNLDYYCKPNQ